MKPGFKVFRIIQGPDVPAGTCERSSRAALGTVGRAAPLSAAPPSWQGRVSTSHFMAQGVEAGGCWALSYLPDEVDAEPRHVVESVALQEKGEGVGAGCAGIAEVGPADGGELLLHLRRWKNRVAASTEQCWGSSEHPHCGEEPHNEAASKDQRNSGLRRKEDLGGCRLLSRLSPCPETAQQGWQLLRRISPSPSCWCRTA